MTRSGTCERVGGSSNFLRSAFDALHPNARFYEMRKNNPKGRNEAEEAQSALTPSELPARTREKPEFPSTSATSFQK